MLAACGLPVLFGACAPTAQEAPATRPVAAPAELGAVQRTAWQAWHLMELGRISEGAYTTNALVDLDLPQGVRWDLLDFTDAGYRLRVLRVEEDGTEGEAWIVDPSGVRPPG